ncbi:hypothetical protein GC175_00435 [bacterium]|nr:hypothetical protein [bacterium]
MYRQKRPRIQYPRRLEKIVTLMLVLALLLSVVTPAVQAADTYAPLAQSTDPAPEPGNCEAPNRSAGTMVFLPAIVSNFVENRSAVSPSPNATLNTDAPMTRVLDYQVGKVYTYLYDYAVTTQSLSRNRDETREESPFVTRVNAYADITVLSKAEDGTIDAQLVMRAPFLCASVNPNEQVVVQDQIFFERLAVPLRFKQAANGTITEVMSQPDLSTEVTNIQKGILNFLQLTLQEGETYTASEIGGQGTYTATYQLAEASAGLQITKTISTGDYSQLNSVGGKPESLQLNTTLNMLIGAEQKVLTSVTVVEDHKSADGTQNPANTDAAQGPDGVSVWSTAKTTGSLKLETVADAPADAVAQARSIQALYAADNLGGELAGDYSNSTIIDLATVDLDAEFAALEKAELEADSPDNIDTSHFMRILQLHQADEGTVVVDKIAERLQAVVDNDELAMLYVDLLGEIGTPKAQDYLNGFFNQSTLQAANLAASSTITTQQQVLINMVRLTNPVSQTVNTVRQISNDEQSPLQETASSVLGGVADNLDDYDPVLQQEILFELEEGLRNAESVDDVLLYLSALGNIGDEISALVINQSYITDTIVINGEVLTDTIDILVINIAGYEALRGIPGEYVEYILIEALWNEALELWMRDIIAEVLIDRDWDNETILSDYAYEQLVAYLDLYLDDWYDYNPDEPGDDDFNGDSGNGEVGASATAAEFNRSWNKNFGNAYVGVRLPGSIYAATPPHSNQFGGGPYMRASQRVEAYVWQVAPDLTIASGSAEARYNGSTGMNVNTKVSVLNDSIHLLNNNFFISCTQEVGPFSLLNKYIAVFDKSVTIFVLGVLPITFRVSAGGTIHLAVDAGTNNLCAGDSYGLRLRVSPGISLTIRGEAYVNAAFVQGGAALNGDLIKVSLPTQGYVEYTRSSGALKRCIKVDIAVQPFAVRFYLFARARWNPFSNSWPVNKEWTVAQYSSPSYTYPLYGEGALGTCFDSEPASQFTLVNANANKCVDVAGFGRANGTNIQQWSCSGAGNQRWEEVPANGGFMLRNPDSAKCLSTTSTTDTRDGLNLHIWDCLGFDNQIMNWSGDALIIKYSNKCVDVSGASTNNGANIQQWSCNGTGAQNFRKQP